MGKVQTEEFKRIKKNGDSIFIQASYKPLKDSDGKVFEILKLAQDITQKKLTSLYNQGQIEAINKSQAVIEFDKNGIILNANENFLNTTGYKLEEIIGEHHSIFCEDSYKNSPDYQEFWQKLNEGKFDCGEYLRVGKNNRRIWIQATYNPIFDLDNNIVKIIKFAHDITQEKLSILFYTGQLEAINKSQSIIEFDMNGVILNANENFLQAMGYELHEIVGKYHSIFCDEIYSNSSEYKKFWEELKKGNYDTGKYLRLGKNQKKVWIQATYTPILDIDKKPVKIVKFAQDITKYEIIKKDHLTNLYNREKLIIDIDAEKKEEINLAIIDIDDFSSINDFYGYFVGDKLIIKFSEILIKLLNDEFIVYRIYGDKFAIYNTTFSKKEFYEQMTELCKKIKETSLDLDVKNFHLLITCGISFEEKSKLLNTAEIVNKFAKKVLKNILIYSDELNIEKEYEENIYWAEKIKLAIKEDRIIVHYQAIYNNKTKKIEKYEALVRLQERDGEIISPFKFLNIAKRSKQYLEITKIVIDKSFNTFKSRLQIPPS